MPIQDYSTDPDLNVQISGINIAEGCPPSGINNAIRQLMADVKEESEAKAEAITAAATQASLALSAFADQQALIDDEQDVAISTAQNTANAAGQAAANAQSSADEKLSLSGGTMQGDLFATDGTRLGGGAEYLSAQDFNDFETTGLYYFTYQPHSNGPLSGDFNGMLHVIAHVEHAIGGAVWQYFYRAGAQGDTNMDVFVRKRIGGIWTSWQQVMTTKQSGIIARYSKPSASSIDLGTGYANGATFTMPASGYLIARFKATSEQGYFHINVKLGGVNCSDYWLRDVSTSGLFGVTLPVQKSSVVMIEYTRATPAWLSFVYAEGEEA